ncbi:MAG: lysoplasmalogenase [Clostridia bacterium]|nr:lysoplasmalogenase [Clostridia bacterium]
MSTGYIIGFIALFLLQAFTTPTFLKKEIPKPCTKSLIWKMVCSTLFIITGIVSMMCAGNHTTFAVMMLIGFGFSWLGDFLLHYKSGDRTLFVCGLVSFLTAHIFYIIAYSKVFDVFFPKADFMGVPEVIALAVFISVGFFTQTLMKVDFGEALLPVLFYMNALGIMMIKAVSLGIRVIIAGTMENSLFVGILLIVGGLFFATSDYTLAPLCFKKGIDKHGRLRKLNIWTYFFGQMFLALTLAFVIPE